MFESTRKNLVTFKPYDDNYDYLSLPADDVRCLPDIRQVSYTEHSLVSDFWKEHPKLFKQRNILPFMLSDFLAANSNDFKKTEKNIQDYIDWLHTMVKLRLNKGCLEMLKLGVIYIEGRDESQRPVIVINPSRIDFDKYKKAEVYSIFCRCFIVVQAYMLNYGKVDQWRIIIDGEYQMSFQLNFGLILFLIEKFSYLFPNVLHQIYLIRFNKYLNHEKKQLFQYMIPDGTLRKVFFIFEEDEYKSLIIKTMDQGALEMKFGGFKKNFKEYWQIFESSLSNMNEEELNKQYMLLEQQIDREIMELLMKFKLKLQSLNIRNSFINEFLQMIDEELRLLKFKYRTQKEIDEEEEQVKRNKKRRQQDLEEQERLRLLRLQQEEEEERKRREQEEYDLYLQRQLKLKDAKTRELDFDYDDGLQYKIFNKNFHAREIQEAPIKQLEDEDSIQYRVFKKNFKNYQTDNVESQQVNYDQQQDGSLNYFVRPKIYKPIVIAETQPVIRQAQPVMRYTQPVMGQVQYQQQYPQQSYSVVPQQTYNQPQMVKQNTYQRETQQGIVQIDQQYQFNDNNQTIQGLNNSKIEDINVSRISVSSQDKVYMNRHFKDPDGFVQGLVAQHTQPKTELNESRVSQNSITSWEKAQAYKQYQHLNIDTQPQQIQQTEVPLQEVKPQQDANACSIF